MRRPDEADAAVLQLPDGSAIAVSIDGNGRRVACDPRKGAAEAVYECASNLACVGAEPLGLTNCLNFGNPEKPEVAWQLTEAVEGIAQACEALGVPVVGGNVSLYNEAPQGAIFPTPVIGMVGKLPGRVARREARLPARRRRDRAGGGLRALARRARSSRSWRVMQPRGPLPDTEGSRVRDAQEKIRMGVRSQALHSAHDIAEGGLAVALAECCIAGGIGARITAPEGLELFAEAPGQAFVVSGPSRAIHRISANRGGGGRRARDLGHLKLPLSELRRAHDGGLRYP